ncbi:MAG: hypothetical protein E7465_03125 [Ruminococcaceae bacterium]|nr:hypothetical protein [Oscillospiraceae bacterium]
MKLRFGKRFTGPLCSGVLLIVTQVAEKSHRMANSRLLQQTQESPQPFPFPEKGSGCGDNQLPRCGRKAVDTPRGTGIMLYSYRTLGDTIRFYYIQRTAKMGLKTIAVQSQWLNPSPEHAKK